MSETEIDEETYRKINETLIDAWTNAMSARNKIQQIDRDLIVMKL